MKLDDDPRPFQPAPGYRCLTVTVRVADHKSTRQLVLDTCPFCRRSHRWGAGSPDDSRALLETHLIDLRDPQCVAPFDYGAHFIRLTVG